MKRRLKMLIVYYKMDMVACDFREFRSKEEFEDWFKRMQKINPETEIIKITEVPQK
jgi:hypothetical protein